MCENCEKKDKKIEFLKQQLNDLKIERFNQRDDIVALQNRIIRQDQAKKQYYRKFSILKTNLLNVLNNAHKESDEE